MCLGMIGSILLCLILPQGKLHLQKIKLDPGNELCLPLGLEHGTGGRRLQENF